PHECIQVGLEKAKVFEEGQRSQADEHCGNHESAALTFGGAGTTHCIAEYVTRERHEHHEEHELRVPPAVEYIARQEQPDIANPGNRFLAGAEALESQWQRVVEPQCYRQEVKNEGVGGKDHRVPTEPD